jgi:hypothetical protein
MFINELLCTEYIEEDKLRASTKWIGSLRIPELRVAIKERFTILGSLSAQIFVE